jgi:hypothetical protein
MRQRADTAEPEENRILRIEWTLWCVRKTDMPENIDQITFIKMYELLRAKNADNPAKAKSHRCFESSSTKDENL